MAPAHTHHHTIPAGYLCGFASPVRNRPKLEVLDLQRREWRKRQSPRAVCKQKGFYAVNMPGVPKNVVETDFLGRLETEAIPLIRNLDKRLRTFAHSGGTGRQPEIGPDDLDLLAAFSAMMWVRTESIRGLGQKAANTWIPAAMDRLYPTPEAYAKGREKAQSEGVDVGNVTYEQWTKVMTGEVGRFDFTNEFYAQTMVGAWQKIHKLLAQRPTSFMIAGRSAGLLVTSDAPVSVYKQGNKEFSGVYRTDMRDATTGILLPLSAHFAICFDAALDPSIGLLERERVAMINTATALPDASLVLSATSSYQWWDGHGLREPWDLVEASEKWRQAADEAEMGQIRASVAEMVKDIQPLA